MTSRIDWFSTLVGTSKEYVFYPSVGLSVVLSEIIPLPKKVFSFWKIRGSYAQVGNPPSAYLPYATVVLEMVMLQVLTSHLPIILKRK